MSKFNTIFQNKSLYGGHGFRVTSDGAIANIQSRAPGNQRFKTEVTIPRDEFDLFAEDKGLYDPANDNPGVLLLLINDLKVE
ncbi:hypothetical protein LCGC14_0143360 [marine sediment metagenome]|uniref:Uncharacterized protein n=1 Tax=marine sediment metagenome TaxID=412755 RepID=A0A0F9VFR9_9ZZZZ|tara:strand:- start:205 stop:450 length:246 start_codon:yes stop_codon:yes gene_type:complete